MCVKKSEFIEQVTKHYEEIVQERIDEAAQILLIKKTVVEEIEENWHDIKKAFEETQEEQNVREFLNNIK